MKNILKYLGLAIAGGAVAGFILLQVAPSSQFGGASDPNLLDGTITTNSIKVASASSTTLLSANSARKYAAFVNDCNYDIYFNIGAAASKSWGIRLNKQGGSYEVNTENTARRSFSAIASISDGTDTCRVTTLEAE